jgi:branched-chain amino acid transport system substrate-binding protein
MRHRFVVGSLTLAAAGALGACQLVGDISDRTLETTGDDTSGDKDATARSDSSGDDSVGDAKAGGGKDGGPSQTSDGGPGSDDAGFLVRECTTNAECTDRATSALLEAGATDALPDAAPFTGAIDGGVVPAVCVQSVGKCAALLTPDCRSFYGDYTNDDSILLGTIFNTTGSLAGANIPRQNAALLAAEEINSSVTGGGLPGVDGGAVRPLLVVECDPTANTIRTASHLANDLHVPAVVGPNVAEDALNITNMVSADVGMLLMSPTVPIDPVTALNDNGLTWRDIPSDSQRAPLYRDQILALASQLSSRGSQLKLAVVERNDALGSSAVNAISSVPFNGATIGSAPNVRIDEYGLTDTAAQAAIASAYVTFQPDIVFVIAQEAVANIVVPFEQQLAAMHPGAPKPYYIATDTAKTTGWLTSASGVPADFSSRVRGVGVTPDVGEATTVFNAFNADYKGSYGTNPGTAGMGPAYDAMYSVAYAIASAGATPITGATIAQGLTNLDYGSSFDVGPIMANAAFQALTNAGHITLQGTFTLMHWDKNGDVVGGTLQVWCVSPNGGMPTFAASGRTLDLTSGSLNGTYVQCP